jgi:hypothetical protein
MRKGKNDPRLWLTVRTKILVIDAVLREKFGQSNDSGLTQLLHLVGASGIEGWVFGRLQLYDKGPKSAWIFNILQALLNAPFLATRQPALKLKLLIHNRISRNIASTSGNGNFITINIEEYQVGRFSIGQMLGLLAHELGVHTLDKTTLSAQEYLADQRDEHTIQAGTHGGTRFSVGAPDLRGGQQGDHLTIGRGILGQPSAQPRLQMYRETMLSLLATQTDLETRRQIAAAYCIDIARILVTNDKAPSLLQAPFVTRAIVNVARAEWLNIKRNFRRRPGIAEIDLTHVYLLGCLVNLFSLLLKTRGKPSAL